MGKRRLNCYAGDRHARIAVSGGVVPETFMAECVRLALEAIGPAKRSKVSLADPGSDSVELEFWYGNRDKGGAPVMIGGFKATVTLNRRAIADGVPQALREKVVAVWCAACQEAGVSSIAAE